MSIKLNAFGYDLIEHYFVKNIEENEFWLFGSHGVETERPISKNTDGELRDVANQTIFGIKYDLQDFSFMLPVEFWIQNRVYTQYDDTKELLGTPFYVITEPETESGDYHIFKCLSNAGGSQSSQKPQFNESVQDGIYFLSDGYIWKHMSSTSITSFRKFFSRGLMPVFRDQQIEDIADTGLYNIVVENPTTNNGYERITGISRSIDVRPGVVRIFLRDLLSKTQQINPIFESPNKYINRSIYIQKAVTSSSISAGEFPIIESGVVNSIPFVSIETPTNFTPEAGDQIEILPKVEIIGDGSGASAIPIFNKTNTRIESIKMLSNGDGYTISNVSIADPVSFDPTNVNRQDIRCVLRPIISPEGGHGSNIIKELYVRHIGLSKTVSSVADSIIPSSGSYSKFSVVKNPEFVSSFNSDSFDNRIKITFDGPLPGNIEVGDMVEQGEVKGVVHQLDNETDSIFVINYTGPYTSIFVDTEPLRFEASNFDINTIDYSPYVIGSGIVFSIVDATPIERSNERTEQIKLVLDF